MTVPLLREQIESDLSFTLEGEFRLPVVLIFADGTKQEKSANDTTQDLVGQILHDTIVETLETGLDGVVHRTVVTLRKTSLDQTPSKGDSVLIPVTPNYNATKEVYIIERVSEDGGSIGFVRLYLVKAKQI
jgi:hypothetical protein